MQQKNQELETATLLLAWQKNSQSHMHCDNTADNRSDIFQVKKANIVTLVDHKSSQG